MNEQYEHGKEWRKIEKYLSQPCVCGKNCQEKFSVDEILSSRENFKSLSRNEKNCFILAQL